MSANGVDSANLLVELFVEELPPKALKKLGEAFASVLADNLKAQGLAPADACVTGYASPRRLAVHLTGVLARAADEHARRRRSAPASRSVTDHAPRCGSSRGAR